MKCGNYESFLMAVLECHWYSLLRQYEKNHSAYVCYTSELCYLYPNDIVIEFI